MANFVKRARMDDGWGARRQTPPSLMGSNQQQYGYSNAGQMQQGPVSIGELGSHVLLITVLNPKYPITVEVIHTICKTHGNIERIVIMKKSGVQALVEFDSVESAKRVKNALHGADIYSGCCTLNIGYAKPQRLNVVRNDTESWDYSPNFGMEQIAPARGGALLAEPLGQGFSQNNSSTRPAYVSGGSMGAFGGGDGGYGEQVDEYATEELYDDGGYNSGDVYGNDGNGYMPQSQPSRGHGPRPLINPAQMGGRGGARGGSMGGLGGPGGRGGPMAGRGGLMSDRGGRGGPMAGRGAPMGGGRGAPMGGRGAPMAGARGAPGGMRGGRGAPSLLGQGMQRPGFGQQPMGGDYYGGGEGGADQQGGVLMIYGLNMERMNCNRVFNLFCLFGNISKIKFLKSKEGVAMIQMGDQEGAEKAVSLLHNCPLFGSELHLSHSKQSYIQDVQQPYDLKDGAPSYKDFSASKNNRFQTADMALKNRVSPPSNVLYFYNSPPNMTEASLKDLFLKSGAKPARRTKVFAAKSERSTTGLLEFDTKQDAVEGLVLVNHQEVPNPSGRYPYVFKLCFSGASMDSER